MRWIDAHVIRIVCLLAFFAMPAHADTGDFFEYHTTNIQLLHGWDYEFRDHERTIATLEHFDRWRYGDFFMFADGTLYEHGGNNLYAEFSPRLSFSKISGEKISFGPVKDVLFSTTLEAARHGYRAYLYGGAVDLDLPGFKFASANLYLRNNPDLDGETWQLTLAWKRPFIIRDTKWVTEGFADFAGRESARYAPNQLIVPRVLLDVGEMAGGDEGRLYAGVEWQYWHNKAGVQGVTESVPQLQVKWVFD